MWAGQPPQIRKSTPLAAQLQRHLQRASNHVTWHARRTDDDGLAYRGQVLGSSLHNDATHSTPSSVQNVVKPLFQQLCGLLDGAVHNLRHSVHNHINAEKGRNLTTDRAST